MQNARKGMDIKMILVSIGFIVIILIMFYMLGTTLFGSISDASDDTASECGQQETEDECTSLKTGNWIGSKKNKCFWDEEEQTCGKLVH